MDALLAAVREYPVDRWIFWAGAGVSLSPPSSLPLGGPLTEFVLRFACGDRAAERLLGVWQQVQTLCGDTGFKAPFAYPPRLESILNAVAKAENAAGGEFAVLAGLRSLDTVPANANHLLLAHLVTRGASVFTTNFDTAVQAAFPVLDPALACSADAPRKKKDLYRVYRLRGRRSAGQIAHVHGTAEDPTDLGATIQQVKRGLSPRATAELESRLAAGAVLVFVGYSASDAFDVTPWFQSRARGTWPASRLVFVQHGTDSIPGAAASLAAGFGSEVLANADTTAFLASLAGRTFEPHGEALDWRRRFHAAARPPSPAGQALVTCAVCNELGINVDVVDETAYDIARNTYLERGQDPTLTILSLAARGKGLFEEEKWYLERASDSPDLLYYHYVRGDYASARRLALTLGTIRRKAARRGELDWKPYTSMSVHAREFLDHYVKDPARHPRTRAELERMERLEEVFGLLSGRNFAQVQAIHQVTTALRFQMLFSELRGVQVPGLEERIMGLYAEQAQVQGYVSSWRDFAFARILRLRHGGSVREVTEAATRLLRASHDLAVLIGDEHARRRSVAAARDLRRAAQIARRRAAAGTRIDESNR
jgi:hypothetical protein